jgi:hypothetical protein
MQRDSNPVLIVTILHRLAVVASKPLSEEKVSSARRKRQSLTIELIGFCDLSLISLLDRHRRSFIYSDYGNNVNRILTLVSQ